MALTDWIKMNQQGTTPAPVSTRKTPLELLIAQQAMAQKADPNTMAGFALGKLLRGLFDDWKERYDARGTLNRMAEMDENKRSEILSFLEKNNPTQYQRTQEYLAKNNGTWNGWGKSSQAPTQPTQKLLGDTDFWSQRTPTEPWRDDENWNKWRNIFSGTGWQNGLRF